MDIGLCMSQIAFFGERQIVAQSNIDTLQQELEVVTDGDSKDPATAARHGMILKEMTKWKTKLGFYKDFIEFWKDQIKNFFAQIKGSNELANGAR